MPGMPWRISPLHPYAPWPRRAPAKDRRNAQFAKQIRTRTVTMKPTDLQRDTRHRHRRRPHHSARRDSHLMSLSGSDTSRDLPFPHKVQLRRLHDQHHSRNPMSPPTPNHVAIPDRPRAVRASPRRPVTPVSKISWTLCAQRCTWPTEWSPTTSDTPLRVHPPLALHRTKPLPAQAGPQNEPLDV